MKIREILDVLVLKLIPEHEMLFFEPDKVYVIISGNILMKNHEDRVQLPITYAKYGEGDILNFL
jgi:hypothetical protein